MSEIVPRAEVLFQVFKNKIDVVAKQRLGLDIHTGRAIEPEDVEYNTSRHPHWADANPLLGIEMMEDEELYELVALMETE